MRYGDYTKIELPIQKKRKKFQVESNLRMRYAKNY